jgi:hypothetical protein
LKFQSESPGSEAPDLSSLKRPNTQSLFPNT